MRRRQLIEIHDQRWCPDSLRDVVTDTLQFVWNLFDIYEPIVTRLRRALQETGTCQVVDLCSGGGGPWLRFVRNVEDEDRLPVEVRLTDRFPNLKAFGTLQALVSYEACLSPRSGGRDSCSHGLGRISDALYLFPSLPARAGACHPARRRRTRSGCWHLRGAEA